MGDLTLSVDPYHRALRFAGRVHGEQRLPGTELPYLVHLAGVAMEVVAASVAAPPGAGEPFALQLAAVCAVLHDTVEDTSATVADIEQEFGPAVAKIVSALSKDPALAKAEQMADSLERIAALPPELVRAAAVVKLADRITNLQKPPAHWTLEKATAYRAEAQQILARLAPLAAWEPLARRLAEKIEAYGAFLRSA